MFNYFSQLMRAKRARHWFVKLNNDPVSSDEFYAFNCWLESEPNAIAYQQVEQAWQALGELSQSKEGELLIRHASGHHAGTHSDSTDSLSHQQWGSPIWQRVKIAVTKPPRRWLPSSPMTTAAACVCLCIALLSVVLSPSEQWTEYSTATAETRELTIADGSQIILTPQTTIKVQLGSDRRAVKLLAGHAFFDVAKDAGRPFTVTFKQLSVLVTGTVFGVNAKTPDVKVSVDEGHVAVRLNGRDNGSQKNLTEGQSVIASVRELGEITKTNTSELALWRRGILVYRDTPLSQILEETNSYTLEKVFTSSSLLGDTRISLSININELSELPAMLEELLPVKAVRSDYRKVMLIER